LEQFNGLQTQLETIVAVLKGQKVKSRCILGLKKYLVERVHRKQNNPRNIKSLYDLIGHGGFPRGTPSTQTCRTHQKIQLVQMHKEQIFNGNV